ncbi:MAG: hypothetical protein WD018_07690, partial [Nitrosopumilaceae archaeon]
SFLFLNYSVMCYYSFCCTDGQQIHPTSKECGFSLFPIHFYDNLVPAKIATAAIINPIVINFPISSSVTIS